MTSIPECRSVILVVEDVEETRRGTEQLLTASGYRVDTARDGEEAVMQASLHPPDLILVSPGVDAARAVSMSRRVRDRAGLRPEVPVVFFCVPSLAEGAEVEAGHNVYLTRPDNFDQLRDLLNRLFRTLPRAC